MSCDHTIMSGMSLEKRPNVRILGGTVECVGCGFEWKANRVLTHPADPTKLFFGTEDPPKWRDE